MANLQFDNLFGVVDTPEEPIARISYQRNVDSRSVTFESGVTVLFSDFMSGIFVKFLSKSTEEFTGPSWLKEAWETTLDVFKSQKIGEPQTLQVIEFLLGNADHIVMYQSL